MQKLVLLLLGLTAVSAYPNMNQRIVGGSLTTVSQYPDMAGVLFSWGTTGYSHYCGSTIINNRAVLTAAHCTIGYDAARFRVRVGSSYANSGGSVLVVGQIINHPQYNSKTEDNDVAIVRTSTAIPLSNTVRAGSFAGANYHVADNQVVWVTGWGATSYEGPPSEQLRHVQVWTISQAICRQRYGTAAPVTDNMLCTGWLDVGGRDACQGDSGGPVYHNGVVVGVTSWGAGCADAFYPGVNARVQRYPAWIIANA